jgi:hypothetical protein
MINEPGRTGKGKVLAVRGDRVFSQMPHAVVHKKSDRTVAFCAPERT